MKKIMVLLTLLAINNAYAEDSSMDDLTEYLTNLGTYLGYDITKPKQEAGSDKAATPNESLLDIDATLLVQQYAFSTILGASPVNAFDEATKLFVPTDNTNYSKINDAANYTFQTQPGDAAYNDPATGEQGKVSVSSLIDQITYQNDPVNQAVLNMLSTPNFTFCMTADEKSFVSDCALLYDKQVATNVTGSKLPSAYGDSAFYTYTYNEPYVAQLNANTLISPLLYTEKTSESSGSSGSSSSSTTSSEDGLIASNQIQQATNFIRYATKSVTPSATTSLANYDKLYAQAVNTDGSVAEVDKIKAQHALSTYLANLKTYAAINSVPISNLYYLLSNRMPQESKDGKTQSSQALSEFEMATKRLYDPKKESGSQWIDQINAASAATVQKEIAVLLSELNYQIYLMNQKTDRMLLTQSLALLQVSNAQMPILEVAETEEAVNAE